MTQMVLAIIGGSRNRLHEDEAVVPMLMRFLFWATRNN